MINDVIKEVKDCLDRAHFADKSYVEIETKTLEKVLVYLQSAQHDIDKVQQEAAESRIVYADTTQIFKYPLIPTDYQYKDLCGAPISVLMQRGEIMLYAPHVKDAPTKKYEIRIAGTGHKIKDYNGYTFIGTVSPTEGLIFHIFYKEVA